MGSTVTPPIPDYDGEASPKVLFGSPFRVMRATPEVTPWADAATLACP